MQRTAPAEAMGAAAELGVRRAGGVAGGRVTAENPDGKLAAGRGAAERWVERGDPLIQRIVAVEGGVEEGIRDVVAGALFVAGGKQP